MAVHKHSQANSIFINCINRLQVGISPANRVAMLFLFALHNFRHHTPINFESISDGKSKEEARNEIICEKFYEQAERESRLE